MPIWKGIMIQISSCLKECRMASDLYSEAMSFAVPTMFIALLMS